MTTTITPTKQEITDPWMNWIYQNIQLKVLPETILDVMLSHGFDTTESQLAIKILSNPNIARPVDGAAKL